MSDVFARPVGWLRARWPDALTLLALALLCWVLARWTWVLLAPAPTAAPAATPTPIDVQAALEEVLRARLFSGQPAGEPSPATTAHRDLQLAGILATAPRGGGWAVLQLGAKAQQVAAAGSEIAPDLVLERVFGDHVVVRRGGSRERLELSRRATTSPPAAPALGLNVQQKGVGDYAFSRADLDRALREPGQLSNLGAVSVSGETGARIERAPAGSLAERLGLQPGDMIRSVNGQRIQSDDDLRRLYEQFNQTRQTAWVVLEGRRNDAPLRLRYTVQP
jgi:general secretion pathway protein C